MSYVILLLGIGHGGFGHVVLCKNKLDGRQYALKMIRLKDKSLPVNDRILRYCIIYQDIFFFDESLPSFGFFFSFSIYLSNIFFFLYIYHLIGRGIDSIKKVNLF